MAFRVADQFELEMKLGRPTSEFSDFEVFGDVDDRRIGLTPNTVKTIFIVESIHQIVPTVTIQYKSQSPFFQENYPVVTMEPFILSMGKDKKEEDIFSEHYYFSSTEPDTTEPSVSGVNQNVVLKGQLFPIKFLLSGQNRAYSGVISDVVKSLILNVDANVDFNIDPSNSRQKGNWVQPGWNNAKFLNYLTKKAVSNANNFSNYFSFFRADNKFYFKTLDSLFAQERKENNISKFEFTLSPEKQNMDVMREKKKKKRNDPVNTKESNSVRDFQFQYQAMSGMPSGLLGHKSSGFDWNNGEYNSEEGTLLDFPFHQPLSTRAFYNQNKLLEGDFSTGKENSYIGNSDFSEEVEGKLKEQVMKENSNVSRLEILTSENNDLSIGDIARVDIFDEGIDGNRQDVLSGEWLVENRVRFIYGKGKYLQKYSLIRTGLNEPSTGDIDSSINERFTPLIGGSGVSVQVSGGLGSGGVIS